MEAYGGPPTGTEGPSQATSGTAARPKCPEMTEKQIVEIFLFGLPPASTYSEWIWMEPVGIRLFIHAVSGQFVGNPTSIMQGQTGHGCHFRPMVSPSTSFRYLVLPLERRWIDGSSRRPISKKALKRG